MKNYAAVMTGIEQIEIQERPVPTAGAGQAVVRIEAVGVCGSDVGYYRYGRVANYIVTGDIVLGHEASGQVVEVGSGVNNVSAGDRVAIEPGTPCRTCTQCMHGRYHLCPDLEFLATPPYDGALVQYLLIDAANLHIMPDTMTFEEGALVEPLSVGLWGCHRVGLEPGDDVLVTGAGPVGILAAEAAKALGAGSVTVVDISDFRLEVASKHGFATEKSDAQSSRTFDVLLECSGAPGVLAAGIHRLHEAGRAAVIGIDKNPDVALPLAAMNAKEITLAVVNRYQHTWPMGISLISSGRVNVNDLVTHSFGLAETKDALLAGSTDPKALKSIIYPQKA